MKNISLLLLSISMFISCDLISFKKQQSIQEKPIATVYNKHLYKKDIIKLLPKNLTKQDSVVIAKGLITTWAKEQLLLIKAEENISEVNSLEIEKLVNDYRSSLYINNYKEKLIKQKLDTLITDREIQQYYKYNKENFKLKHDLLQFDYIYFGKDHFEKEKITKSFKSAKDQDFKELEKHLLSIKSYQLQDSTWFTVNHLKKEIPFLNNEPKENLLKKSKFIQKEDSLGVYLVAIKKILNKNETAPLSYATARIKQIILHKRKLELIREIEKTLINDAIQNKNLKEY
ncbi:MAG: hypothetical protein ACK5H1_04130 [Tenacibaculum sp.]